MAELKQLKICDCIMRNIKTIRFRSGLVFGKASFGGFRTLAVKLLANFVILDTPDLCFMELIIIIVKFFMFIKLRPQTKAPNLIKKDAQENP